MRGAPIHDAGVSDPGGEARAHSGGHARGRLQTVTQDTNPRYCALIEAFRELTGVPMVPNTSINESDPVVCKLGEARDCSWRTRMNVPEMGG